MNSVVLSTVARLLVGVMLLFSLFLLWRGHNEPGGGFIGGLVAAAAFVVFTLATSPREARALLHADPGLIAVIGLAIAAASGLLSAFAGKAFLSGLWLFLGATETSKGLALGTPLIFDLGVYLAVVGGVAAMVLALEEAES